MKLPALFIGHGSPMNAITPTVYSQNWAKIGHKLRVQYAGQIRAILMISAHWCTRGTAVTAMSQPRTIHDFYGFPQELFEIQYPVPGNLQIAEQIARQTGAALNTDWGLDHGSWSILKHMFPDADIPVLQLSLDVNANSQAHYQLGKQLAALRENGILLIGSGDIVHNLRAMDWHAPDSTKHPHPWAKAAQEWTNQLLTEKHFEEFANSDRYPPEISLAAPTPEHFWPLLYILGAADQSDSVSIFNDDIVGKSLSMTSIIIGNNTLI